MIKISYITKNINYVFFFIKKDDNILVKVIKDTLI